MNKIPSRQAFYDSDKAAGFLDQISTVLNSGAVAIMLSVGHRTGLLGTLSKLPPSTSRQIAAAAELNERYVREWLAVMVTGRIVDYDAEAKMYSLPPEHAASLTPAGQLGNLAVYAQFIALAGSMQHRLTGVFESGDGIPYGEFPCFHEIMSEDSDQTVAAGLFDILAELVPDVVERLAAGIDVLDAGCGAGRTAIRLAELFPNSRIAGLDLCEDAIAMAQSEACRRKVSNVTFNAADLSSYDAVSRFDLITSFDAVHDVKDPRGLLRTIERALRAGGAHIMQDIGGSAHLENNLDFPFAPLLYAISCVHCTPVSLAQGGEGLGAMWGWETAQSMLQEAGFSETTRKILPHDPMNVWFVSRKE